MKEKEMAERVYDTLMKNTDNPQFPINETTNEEIDCENNIISFRIGKVDYNIIIKAVFCSN